MADLAVREPCKDRRHFGFGATHLAAVVVVVDPDADDLAGISDNRQPIDVREAVSRGGTEGLSQRSKCLPCDDTPEIRKLRARTVTEIDDLVPVHDTPTRLIGDTKAG
jgi:hypothetical protein